MPFYAVIACVAVGGGFGAVCRFLTSIGAVQVFDAQSHYGTMVVNILGSLLVGVCASWFLSHPNDLLKALVVTGFLGGFTTFSAFSLDFYTLWERGDVIQAVFYLASTVLVSVAMVICGLLIGRSAF